MVSRIGCRGHLPPEHGGMSGMDNHADQDNGLERGMEYTDGHRFVSTCSTSDGDVSFGPYNNMDLGSEMLTERLLPDHWSHRWRGMAVEWDLMNYLGSTVDPDVINYYSIWRSGRSNGSEDLPRN